jgi:hypothetical protein
MTAKDLILKLIENENQVQTVIDNFCVKDDSGITLEQLQKLKHIVDNPTKITFQVSNKSILVTLLNQEL